MADRWRFTAIDESGRVQRGVLRADSSEDARERLLSGGNFAKQIEPAEDDAPITWAPKDDRRRGAADTAGEKVLHRIEALLRRGEWRGEGTLFVTATGIRFEGPGEPVTVARNDVERATLRGFPKRVLEVQLMTSEMLEFDAGFVRTHPVFETVQRVLTVDFKR